MEERESLIITSELEGVRLDAFLATHYVEHSRSYFQYLIKEGAVLVNGMQVKKRTILKIEDEIEACFLLTPEIDLKPEAIPLEILFEDEHLLAINKPAGMVVHPAPGHPSQTFVNALLHHCATLPKEEGNLRPGIVHRLDKDTTGVLLAAKTTAAHKGLVSLFSDRKIEKKYLALCVGNPSDQTISLPIARHPVNRKQMCVSSDNGKEAITKTRVLDHNENFTLIEVGLMTGRTHQIRVHLKHIGCPILGDPTYGPSALNKKFNLSRQLLHAHSVSFIHPITLKALNLTAPIPADMKEALKETLQKSCIESLHWFS